MSFERQSLSISHVLHQAEIEEKEPHFLLLANFTRENQELGAGVARAGKVRSTLIKLRSEPQNLNVNS